jgi:hypothetical protein
MGYYMEQRYADFHIKKVNFNNVIQAIKNLHGEEIIADSSGSHFSWVDQKFYTYNNIKELFDAWRWEVSHAEDNDDADIIDINFSGEKLGDDFELFQAIAPWVEKDSYIEMQGEDGSSWRWCFDGKKCIEKSAKIVWD